LAVKLKAVEHQGEQSIVMRTDQLSELNIEDGIEERLHYQIEHHKRLSPVVGDEHFFHALA
jgi:hypothetical protein